MLAQAFMRHAFLAGTFVALGCGLVGYFVVLRGEIFAGDALSHVALTGALAGAAFGVDPRLALFAATAALALALGALGQRARADDVAIGSTFAWVWGLGALFLSIFTATRSGGSASGAAGVRVLFGSLFGLSTEEAWVAAAIAAMACVAVLVIARPLVFASSDGLVARARGVPVRTLGVIFLLLVGLMAAEATQAVGALLLLGLLAAPAGASHALTARPYRGMALSATFSVAAMWAGLALAYMIPHFPPSSAVITVATAIYVAAFATARLRDRRSTARGFACLTGASSDSDAVAAASVPPRR